MRDVVAKVAEWAKENEVKVPEVHLTESQWYALVEELDDFPPIVTGYMYLNDVKVICPHIHEQWQEPRRLSVTWDGSNIDELLEVAKRAYKVRNVSFDEDQSIELVLYRREWDPGGAHNVVWKLRVGEELVVELR